jgi:hypothetical protein
MDFSICSITGFPSLAFVQMEKVSIQIDRNQVSLGNDFLEETPDKRRASSMDSKKNNTLSITVTDLPTREDTSFNGISTANSPVAKHPSHNGDPEKKYDFRTQKGKSFHQEQIVSSNCLTRLFLFILPQLGTSCANEHITPKWEGQSLSNTKASHCQY